MLAYYSSVVYSIKNMPNHRGVQKKKTVYSRCFYRITGKLYITVTANKLQNLKITLLLKFCFRSRTQAIKRKMTCTLTELPALTLMLDIPTKWIPIAY